jgi:hypothetical protein
LASARIDGPLRTAVVRDFTSLLSVVMQAWDTASGALRPCPPGHGILTADATREVVRDSVRGVVVPGLRALGFHVQVPC